jgi:seryl-tRNA synthetase
MTATTGKTRNTGLGILGPDQTDLLKEVDGVFTAWAAEAGAREILPPSLYRISDLQKFDVYRNFPHMAFVAGPLDVEDGPPDPVDGAFAPNDLERPSFGLPHATCYGAYLYYEGQAVSPTTTVTLLNRCFRREERYEELRRVLGFQLREIVAIGTFEHTQEVIERFGERTEKFARELEIDLRKVASADPFFENDGSRALFQRLSPVKYEFQVGELAVASVNTHRNFFGERCSITVEGVGGNAYTSCIGFGLERWLAVLDDRFDGDLRRALEAVRDLST